MKPQIHLLLVALIWFACNTKPEKVKVYLFSKHPQTEYAMANVSALFNTDAIQRTNSEEDADLVVLVDEDNSISQLKPEGFSLQKGASGQWEITGKDPIGAMYGLFEVAEHLSMTYWKTIIELKERFNKRDIPYVFNAKMDYHQYMETLQNERNSFQEIDEFWVHHISTLNF